MKNFFSLAENLISGMLPFVFLVVSGAYLTLKSGFFQLKLLPTSLKYALGGIFSDKNTENGISPFQAACTALSSTVGTGNIAGVAGALAIGGAGAVFWMWVSAFAGMAVKVCEIILAVFYREKQGDTYVGGPMYYIKNGLPKVFLPLAYAFATAGIAAVILSGCLTQTNSAAASLNMGLSGKLAVGVVFAVITALVVSGGMGRIGAVSERAVPVMALLYILMTFGVIGANISEVPLVFKMIIKGAFNPFAVTGGAVGSISTVIMTGASRGVFSNEAGLGTSAMAHSAAGETAGVKQSLYGIFEVFTDTLVICTLTALTILISGVNIEYGKAASSELVGTALRSVYGKSALFLLAVMMCLFGLSSVIGWGFYGIACSEFIFGKSGGRVFVFVYPFFCIVGALCRADTAWRLAAFSGGIMLCINVFAVMLLSDIALKKMREFMRENGKTHITEKRKHSDKGKNGYFKKRTG